MIQQCAVNTEGINIALSFFFFYLHRNNMQQNHFKESLRKKKTFTWDLRKWKDQSDIHCKFLPFYPSLRVFAECTDKRVLDCQPIKKSKLAPLRPIMRKFRSVRHDRFGSYVANFTYNWSQWGTRSDSKYLVFRSSHKLVPNAFLIPCFSATVSKAVDITLRTKCWLSLAQCSNP